MTRYKVEFEVAVPDDDQFKLDNFKSKIDRFLGDNVPGRSGWAATNAPLYTKQATFRDFIEEGQRDSADPRWQAILAWIDNMSLTKRNAGRGVAMYTKQSGAHKGSIFCKTSFYTDANMSTREVYLVEAYERTYGIDKGNITIQIHGPYEDSGDEYWIQLAEGDKQRGNAIITEDWTHRTVSKDDPEMVRLGGGGHGGAEFRFEIDKATVERLPKGLNVVEVSTPGQLEPKYLLVTHNCWYQGVIPRKHRHLFGINAEMVTGFNPRTL
jgi:hypothetical protein